MKVATIVVFLLLSIAVIGQATKEILYVGTYSVRGSEGIYVYEFDRAKGDFTLLQSVKTLENPTFIAIHPSGKFLYSVNRGPVPGSEMLGSVSAYVIDSKSGMLTLLNHQSSYGAGPCHITIDHTGKLAFISNYAEGSFTVLPLAGDGSLGACSDSIRFTGKGINAERQEKSHIHSATVSPDNHFVYVADLGTDKIHSFEINLKEKKLTALIEPFVSVKPGSGPRHFTFTPNGKYAYLAEELTSTVATFSYNKKNGALELIADRIISLPSDFKEKNTSADIHTDASGKFLMLSNRGHESLALYAIKPNGGLTLKENIKTRGQKPRNFLVDSKNKFVFVAHQDTDNIVIFKLDANKGELSETKAQIQVPSPVCLKMLELKN
jgi:6-phosphogluconolactonase